MIIDCTNCDSIPRGASIDVLYRTILPAVAKPFDPQVISSARPRRDRRVSKEVRTLQAITIPGVAPGDGCEWHSLRKS